MLEREIEEEILFYLNKKGIFAWKNLTGGYFDPVRKRYRKQSSKFAINGVSDIIGIYESRPLFIEVKSKKGVVRKEQKQFIARAQREGALAFIARSVDDVDNYLREQ